MQTILTNVIEQAVLERMRAKECFTALDISNALKADRYPFRHREVAAVVRDIFNSGAMDFYDYERELIPVVTDHCTQATQAFLYHPTSVRPREYIARDQDALPPVPADQARDISDCVAAGPLTILPRPCPSSASMGRRAVGLRGSRRSRHRRDGALSIPRRLVEQLGWAVGQAVSLKAESGRLMIGATLQNANGGVRVWSGYRVRVCKTKLRLGALHSDTTRIEMDGDCLRIEAKD